MKKGRSMRAGLWRRVGTLVLLLVLSACAGEPAPRRPAPGGEPPAAGASDVGWILMDTDREHISSVLGRAAGFGVDHVQLSHDLIMDIDEINEDDGRARLLQDVAREAHALGLAVWVWSHELARESYLLCFDPADPVWERRKEAYRQALQRVPEIDGVVLMFGSSDVEPWYALCLCDWCAQQPPTGNPVLDLLHSRPPERLQQIYGSVGNVVMGEFGRRLRIRTFMHRPAELDWLGESLRTWADRGLAVMSKDVPQDWQPYYPHNPLIGNVGERDQIVEMDLGNEYWGRSRILNGQVDILFERIRYGLSQGVRGAAARIERGGDHALGNPNEINIHAFSRFLQDEAAVPDRVYREWFELRYGFPPASEASDTLKQIFRTSHFAMRKMYYTLGMWSLEKGSDVPDHAGYPAELWSRNTTPYDPAWEETFRSLAFPTEQTILDLWQESREAQEIAGENLARLDSIRPAFASAGDFQELRDMLELHRDCTDVWLRVKDAVFRSRVAPRAAHAAYLRDDADRLAELADRMESRWGPGVSPGNPARIRAFAADLERNLSGAPPAVPWTQPVLARIRAEPLPGGRVRIRWESSEPMTSWVEWGPRLPVYPASTPESSAPVREHEVEISVEDPGIPHVFRAAGRTARGATVRSGDFWFGLDP